MKSFLFVVLSLVLCSHISLTQMIGGWSNVDPNTIQYNPTIEDALIFGAHSAIHKGIEQGTISKANYEIINIFNVRQQVVSGMNYAFDVEMASDTDYFVRVTYVVLVQSWKHKHKKEMKVTSFEFFPLLQSDAASDNNNENEFDLLVYEDDEDDRARMLSANDGGNDESESEDKEETGATGEWTQVNPSELNSNSDMHSAFNFGLRQAIQANINHGSLPSQNYKKEKIYSIESQVVSGYNYRFEVELKGDRGAVARMIFEVYSQSWTNTQELISSQVIALSNKRLR